MNAVWKKGDLEPTAEAFRRLLWLDPHDNLGARFNLAAVEAGRRWEDVRDEDGPGPYG